MLIKIGALESFDQAQQDRVIELTVEKLQVEPDDVSFEKPVYEDFIDPSTAATNLEQIAAASPFLETDSKMTYGTD